MFHKIEKEGNEAKPDPQSKAVKSAKRFVASTQGNLTQVLSVVVVLRGVHNNAGRMSVFRITLSIKRGMDG